MDLCNAFFLPSWQQQQQQQYQQFFCFVLSDPCLFLVYFCFGLERGKNKQTPPTPHHCPHSSFFFRKINTSENSVSVDAFSDWSSRWWHCSLEFLPFLLQNFKDEHVLYYEQFSLAMWLNIDMNQTYTYLRYLSKHHPWAVRLSMKRSSPTTSTMKEFKL